MQTALINVDINLASIKDEKFVRKAQKRKNKLKEQGEEKMRQVVDKIEARL